MRCEPKFRLGCFVTLFFSLTSLRAITADQNADSTVYLGILDDAREERERQTANFERFRSQVVAQALLPVP